MPHIPAAHPLLLPSVEPRAGSASTPSRSARGGTGCRAITTPAMLAEVERSEATLTRASSGRAHRARGTYTRMTDERVAAFLAAEVTL